jgi:hypothetical protein
MALSPLIRFGTFTWTYEGWQGQVYKREYKKTTFARECLGEYCQYLYNGKTLSADQAYRAAVLDGILWPGCFFARCLPSALREGYTR